MAGTFVEIGNGNGKTNDPIYLLIWGDSHAMAVTPVLDDLCSQFSRRGVLAAFPATAPILGYISTSKSGLQEKSPAAASAIVGFIAQRHVKNVLIVACWSIYPASDLFKAKLLVTIRTLIDLGARVYVLKLVPQPGFDVPRFAAITAMRNGDLDQLGIIPEKHRMAERELAGTFEQIAQMGATVLDPADYFFNRKGLYGVVKNDQVLYYDKGHLTVEGSKLLAPLFKPIFLH